MKNIINNIPLMQIPNLTWKKKFENVIKDNYVSKKYNRKNRLISKINYIDNFVPEIKNGNGYILDLGPGPGEFLEVCRYYNNEIIGIDAKLNESEMGNEYMKLSHLMTERQKIPVLYNGFENYLKTKLPFDDSQLSVVNSQGSIEQIFKKYMVGIPHLQAKKASLLSWNINDELFDEFEKMFNEVQRVLKKDGLFIIYANGAKNTEDYHNFILKICKKTNFSIQKNIDFNFHKMRKND